MNCSRCDRLLKPRRPFDGAVVMDGCERCGGVWLDAGEAEAVIRTGLLPALVDFMRFLSR